MTLGIQPIHIVVIIVVALLIFGPKRLPELGRSIGKAINEFRQGTKDITDSVSREINKSMDAQSSDNSASIKTNSPGPFASVPIQPSPMPPARSGDYCIQCGSLNQPEARFCNQCGAKLPEKTIRPTGPSTAPQ